MLMITINGLEVKLNIAWESVNFIVPQGIGVHGERKNQGFFSCQKMGICGF